MYGLQWFRLSIIDQFNETRLLYVSLECHVPFNIQTHIE